MIEIQKGMPVSMVYPDQGADGMGTLFIPNTVSLVAGGPHGQAAESLVDYLLSATVEAQLARGPSAQIPLRRELAAVAQLATPNTIRPLEVDFEQAAAGWDVVEAFLEDEFARAD